MVSNYIWDKLDAENMILNYNFSATFVKSEKGSEYFFFRLLQSDEHVMDLAGEEDREWCLFRTSWMVNI